MDCPICHNDMTYVSHPEYDHLYHCRMHGISDMNKFPDDDTDADLHTQLMEELMKEMY